MSRTDWFEEARFGLFVHWNVCAALEGRFCGEPVRQSEYGEWLRARNRVPRADWDRAAAMLHITPDIVDSWAEAALDAGMKYVVFVTKHHDGLAYWPSKLSSYTLNNLSGVDFDVVGRLKEACQARGLKLGFYYSHWHDWEDPGGWGNFWDYNSDDPAQFERHEDFFFYGGEGYRDNLTPDQFDAYWRGKSMGQVRELMETYQPDLLWFDCWRAREDTNMTQEQVQDMLAMIREIDPACVVNSRLSVSQIGGPGGVDYETLGDNEFPERKEIGHPWESAVTFSLSWGYCRDDQNWRPATYFIRNLVRNISLGGNLLINFGPMADGRAPREALACMAEIGRCIRANGEGYYGCGFTPFKESTQDWGLTTYDHRQNALFLHVFDWPVDGVVRVNGLETTVSSVSMQGEPLKFQQNGQSVHVFGPRSMPVAYDTVIRLDLAESLSVDNYTIGEVNGGGIVMQASRSLLRRMELGPPVEGSTKLPFMICGWSTEGANASWDIFIPQAGPRDVSVCYASTVATAGQRFTVSSRWFFDSVDDQTIEAKVKATQSNWSEFRPFSIGKLDFLKPGPYTITVRPEGEVEGDLFRLLWVFLAPSDGV